MQPSLDAPPPQSGTCCHHCGRLISPTPLKRRKYCNEHCKRAAARARHRDRQLHPPPPLPFRVIRSQTPKLRSLQPISARLPIPAPIYPPPMRPRSRRLNRLNFTLLFILAIFLLMLLAIFASSWLSF